MATPKSRQIWLWAIGHALAVLVLFSGIGSFGGASARRLDDCSSPGCLPANPTMNVPKGVAAVGKLVSKLVDARYSRNARPLDPAATALTNQTGSSSSSNILAPFNPLLAHVPYVPLAWLVKAPLPTRAVRHAVAGDGTYLYVIGGQNI